MHQERHAAVSAWRERGTPHLVEAGETTNAAEGDAEEAPPITPEVVAHFDSTIKQLRAEIAVLRTVLEEQRVAAENKKAQMVTLNMALNGAPREEAERYLSQNFRLADARPILDEAYGRDAS
jgi:hypothetical protein